MCKKQAWKHGNDAVGREPLVHSDLLANLLGDLAGQRVVAVGVVVGEPTVGRAQEILILYVDKVLSVPNQVDVGLGDGAVHHPTLFGVEVRQALVTKIGRVGGDRPDR